MEGLQIRDAVEHGDGHEVPQDRIAGDGVIGPAEDVLPLSRFLGEGKPAVPDALGDRAVVGEGAPVAEEKAHVHRIEHGVDGLHDCEDRFDVRIDGTGDDVGRGIQQETVPAWSRFPRWWCCSLFHPAQRHPLEVGVYLDVYQNQQCNNDRDYDPRSRQALVLPCRFRPIHHTSGHIRFQVSSFRKKFDFALVGIFNARICINI